MKINISSKVLEKSVDLAKDFLGKLIIPAVEEAGLLIKDHVTMWKFNNQVKMLNKAKVICEKNGISPKTISLKLLCPLLDYSALEEEEVLQDKWATLLANMVDSEQNINNHVFPYLLSQISLDEFLLLESVYFKKTKRIEELTEELSSFKATKSETNIKLQKELEEINSKILECKNSNDYDIRHQAYDWQRKKWSKEYEINSLNLRETNILNQIKEPEYIQIEDIKPYELSNLIRLGVIKFVQRPYANTTSLEIPNDSDRSYLTVDFDIDIESDTEEYFLTELGEIFIHSCTEKKSV